MNNIFLFLILLSLLPIIAENILHVYWMITFSVLGDSTDKILSATKKPSKVSTTTDLKNSIVIKCLSLNCIMRISFNN